MDKSGDAIKQQALRESRGGVANDDFIKTDSDDDVMKNDVKTTTSNQQYRWYNINLSMVPTKLAYLFECARRIGFAPNLVLFLIGIGLNKEESGFIVGLRYVKNNKHLLWMLKRRKKASYSPEKCLVIVF